MAQSPKKSLSPVRLTKNDIDSISNQIEANRKKAQNTDKIYKQRSQSTEGLYLNALKSTHPYLDALLAASKDDISQEYTKIMPSFRQQDDKSLPYIVQLIEHPASPLLPILQVESAIIYHIETFMSLPDALFTRTNVLRSIVENYQRVKGGNFQASQVGGVLFYPYFNGVTVVNIPIFTEGDISTWRLKLLLPNGIAEGKIYSAICV